MKTTSNCERCKFKSEYDGNETVSYTIPAPISDDTPAIPTPTKQPTVPDNVQRFRRISQDLANLYALKNEDYGDSFGRSVEKYGLISALTRISDKFNRLESLILAHGNAKVSDESLDDTLKDLAAYCIMTLVAREQQKEKETVLDAMDGLSTTALGGRKC